MERRTKSEKDRKLAKSRKSENGAKLARGSNFPGDMSNEQIESIDISYENSQI